MKRARVEIGSLVLRHSGFSPAEGAALGRLIEGNLGQLLLRGDVPTESRRAKVVQVHAGPYHSGSNIAGTIARALYRSMKGKI